MAPATLDLLRRTLTTAPAARQAVRPLAPGVQVALHLEEGPAAFTLEGGAPRLEAGLPLDPDFTLRLPRGAVERLAGRVGEDVGEAGLAFFELLLERDPALRVGASVQATAGRLVRHGWLAVLALGGTRVALWLLRRGLASPAKVIERLRGRSH